VELQSNVLNGIDKEMKKIDDIRQQFWKLKELKRYCANLSKIANVDKKSKADLLTANKDACDAEKELVDLLNDMKEVGIIAIDNIWNEYCRIEAEYFSRMNDAYLEPSTPRETVALKDQKSPKKNAQSRKVASPVIGDDEEYESEREEEDEAALAS
jgi:hypothetical protein